MAADDFPRQHAETRRFSLGRPRSFRISQDGSRVLFLRSPGATDPTTALWVLDVGSGDERRLVDPLGLDVDDSALPAEERARRERARESAGGVVTFATDQACETVAFTLAGELFTVDVTTGQLDHLPTVGPAFDPRPAPDGASVAYTSRGGLHLTDQSGTATIVEEPGVTWGLAEFIAAEELQRSQGYWWAPDGARLLVARVDDSMVRTWHISDPAHPEQPASDHRYPAAGTPNADVTLWIVPADGGARTELVWDRAEYPYVAQCSWARQGPTIQVLSRDQRRSRVLLADPATGDTRPVAAWTDPHWIDVIPGTPSWSGGCVVTVRDDAEGDTRRLWLDDEPASPDDLQVHAVVAAADDAVWFTGSDEPLDSHLFRLDRVSGSLETVTEGEGTRSASVVGDTRVIVSASMAAVAPTVEVVGERTHRIRAHTTDPAVDPRVRMLQLGEGQLRGALLLPTSQNDGPLPVLLDPYGGPHAQRVVRNAGSYLTSQWFADQGFAVLVVDGRGTPGRGPAFERAVAGDLATAVLADQVDALHAAAEIEPRLDLDRVGIRGWSFGGFLAALAVLRRPDVFRAAVAGAPVTDWRLYDTAYTERYLGHPDDDPHAYRVSSLVDHEGLVDAAPWPDPVPELMIIHGLADDNVVAAHALRLSAALLADGRPHRFLPLSGVTHMTPQVVVAENLLRLQGQFLRSALSG